MRNPAEIAWMLGWPEAKIPDGACLHSRLAAARDCPTCGPTVAVELAPKLVVRKGSGGWSWWVVRPDGHPIASNFDQGFNAWHPTHAQALAVGLAALETASVRTRT